MSDVSTWEERMAERAEQRRMVRDAEDHANQDVHGLEAMAEWRFDPMAPGVVWTRSDTLLFLR